MNNNIFKKTILLVGVASSSLISINAGNIKIVTVENEEELVHFPHGDVKPIDSTAITAIVNTSTKELTLEYSKSHIASNVDVYRNGEIVASAYQGVDAGDTMKFSLAGSGDYEIVVDNYDETSDEELSGTFTLE